MADDIMKYDRSNRTIIPQELFYGKQMNKYPKKKTVITD